MTIAALLGDPVQKHEALGTWIEIVAPPHRQRSGVRLLRGPVAFGLDSDIDVVPSGRLIRSDREIEVL